MFSRQANSQFKDLVANLQSLAPYFPNYFNQLFAFFNSTILSFALISARKGILTCLKNAAGVVKTLHVQTFASRNFANFGLIRKI